MSRIEAGTGERSARRGAFLRRTAEIELQLTVSTSSVGGGAWAELSFARKGRNRLSGGRGGKEERAWMSARFGRLLHDCREREEFRGKG